MSEPAARQRLREAREKAAAEREAVEANPVPVRPKPASTGGPSMFRAAVEAAAAVLSGAPPATVEQVALAVLRVVLPLHETQHAAALKAAAERAVHFEWELARLRAKLGTEWGVRFPDNQIEVCDSEADARDWAGQSWPDGGGLVVMRRECAKWREVAT